VRILSFLVALILSCFAWSEENNSKYFVFIGEKVSFEYVEPKDGKPTFNSQYLAKYKVISPYLGEFKDSEIVFTVFDHYGKPPFLDYDHVLLYVEYHDGRYYHSKYQYTPLYQTVDGRWAGAYPTNDYTHSYNENTKIKPEKIDFLKPVVIDISDYEKADLQLWFPTPYYQIEGNTAIAVYGNYVEQLFTLKQSGVLKARGDFQ
jgi:hypothetical protein